MTPAPATRRPGLPAGELGPACDALPGEAWTGQCPRPSAPACSAAWGPSSARQPPSRPPGCPGGGRGSEPSSAGASLSLQLCFQPARLPRLTSPVSLPVLGLTSSREEAPPPPRGSDPALGAPATTWAGCPPSLAQGTLSPGSPPELLPWGRGLVFLLHPGPSLLPDPHIH